MFTKDTKAWKTALAVKKESVPVVVVLDAAGQVIWTYEGVFSEDGLHEVESKFRSVHQ